MANVKTLNLKIKRFGINAVASACGLNKSTLSRYVNFEREYSLKNFEVISSSVKEFERKSLRWQSSVRHATERVLNGEDWRIAYFDFVDSFLATRSELLIEERPADGLELKLLVLICSIVMQLCHEQKVSPPEWAKLNLQLAEPWFVSRFKNLRAISLVESPLFFKRNNIYVGGDFLKRA